MQNANAAGWSYTITSAEETGWDGSNQQADSAAAYMAAGQGDLTGQAGRAARKRTAPHNPDFVDPDTVMAPEGAVEDAVDGDGSEEGESDDDMPRDESGVSEDTEGGGRGGRAGRGGCGPRARGRGRGRGRPPKELRLVDGGRGSSSSSASPAPAPAPVPQPAAPQPGVQVLQQRATFGQKATIDAFAQMVQQSSNYTKEMVNSIVTGMGGVLTNALQVIAAQPMYAPPPAYFTTPPHQTAYAAAAAATSQTPGKAVGIHLSNA